MSATHADATARDGEPWSAAARRRLAESDAALAARFDAGEDIDRLLRERARGVDALVREAWAIHVGARSPSWPTTCARASSRARQRAATTALP